MEGSQSGKRDAAKAQENLRFADSDIPSFFSISCYSLGSSGLSVSHPFAAVSRCFPGLSIALPSAISPSVARRSTRPLRLQSPRRGMQLSTSIADMTSLRGYITSYPPRVRQYGNALLTPVYPVQTGPTPRTTKRGTMAINYAEDGFDEEDFDESDGPRRPTGLRSLRREESATGSSMTEKLGKEARAPVEVQGVFREWMIKRMLRPA